MDVKNAILHTNLKETIYLWPLVGIHFNEPNSIRHAIGLSIIG